MSLYEQLNDDLKRAMREGDAFRRDVIRLLGSAVKNAAIEKRKPVAEMADAEVEEVIKRGIKQRKDSIEQYEAGGRAELADKERQEMEVLQAYLPEAMPEDAVRALVAQAVTESGAAGMADFGKAMGAAMKLVAGRADGTLVKRLVEETLKG